MIRLFIFLVLLVGAVLLGLLIKAEPGYMLIAYKHWTIEMPLWFGILGIIVSFWILYWIVKFLAVTFGLPDRVRFWSGRRRLRKAQHKTNQGLIALAEGNWLVAEKYLAHGARISDTPLINYLAAARAAQARGAYDRRDYYLRQAHVVNPEAEIAVGLTQAQLQLEHHQLEQALATIMHVRTLVPNHKFVLQLLQELYLSLNDWQSLEKLLPSLQKYKILSSENLEKLTIQVYENLLKQAGLKKYQEVWHTVPRYLHIQPCLVLIYADYLIQEKNTHQS
ncbi:MAG: heme biosynthesis HemY N-terminal domain-containing protein [Gammaproteobacteria bacterium]